MSRSNISTASVVHHHHQGSSLCFQCHRPVKFLPSQEESFRFCTHCDSGRPQTFEEEDLLVTARESAPFPGLTVSRSF